MSEKKVSPVAAGNGDRLGNLHCSPADEFPVDTAPAKHLQVRHLARFGLSAERAALLAPFVFAEVQHEH